jgi:hypothetical protein
MQHSTPADLDASFCALSGAIRRRKSPAPDSALIYFAAMQIHPARSCNSGT